MERRKPLLGSPGSHVQVLFGADFGSAVSMVRTFGNDVGEAITVNGEHYRTMITEFLCLELNFMEVCDMWFQQNGTTDARLDILHERFEGMGTSRRGDVNWQPKSCDWTLIDLSLWGFPKSQVYDYKPQSTDALLVNITITIAQSPPNLCARDIKN